MTLATAWVRRGIAAEFPRKYEVDEAELGRIEKLAKLQLRDAQDELSAAQANDGDDGDDDSEDDEDIEDAGAALSIQGRTFNGTSNGNATDTKPTPGDDDDLKEYNLSDYDDDEAEAPAANGEPAPEKFAMFGNVRSLAYHNAGEEDPYLVLPPGEDDSDDDREELQILPTDNLILAAKVEDEVPHLEVLVYEDDEDNIYVHHDIMLPAIPLCLEWLDNPVGQDATSQKKTGNYVAVGMMAPEIEVWDLDIVDGMYPTAILGATPDEPQPQETEEPTAHETSKKSKKQDRDKKKKKKKPQKPQPNDTHHVDAVLTLALNPHHRNLLASGSADTTLKLWDLNSADHTRCAKSFTIHAGKVTSLSWHPSPDKSTILLSGSADDHTVAISDLRSSSGPLAKWHVEADVERVRWDPHNPDHFYVTTEAGTVHYFNSSAQHTPPKPLWTLQAHDTAVSAFDINPTIPGFLATGSDDKKVKLWDVRDNKPSLVVSRNLDVGRVFSALFAPDELVAFRLCVAGSRGQVQVWDTSTNAAVRGVFAGRARRAVMREGEERVVRSRGAVGSESDDEDESEEEEKGGGWESMDED